MADIGRADEDRDLAEVLVVTQELMSLADLLEAHRLPQHRADLRFLDQLVCLRRLPGVGEVRPQDLLLAHPQVADVEVELVPGRSAADHHFAEWLDHQDGGRERRLADVLEDHVRRAAEDLLDLLAETP